MENEPSSLTKLITGVFPASFGKAVTILFGFFCVLLYSRFLTKDEYGVYILFQVFLGFVLVFTDFGISISAIKIITYAGPENSESSIFNTLFFFRSGTLILFVLIAFLVEKFFLPISILHSPLVTYLIFIYFIIAIFIEGMNTFFTASYAGLFKFSFLGITESIMSVTSFIITYVLIVWYKQGVMGAIYGRMISRIIAFTLYMIWMRPIFKFEFKTKVIKELIQFSAPLYINQILSLTYSRFDTVILGSLLGTAQTAIYEIGRVLPDSLEQLAEAFQQVYYSLISKNYARNDKEEVNYIINHSTRLISFISLLATLFILLFGGNIISILFSEKYEASIPVLNLLMILLSFKLITYVLGNALVAIGESKKPPIVNFFRAVVLLPSYYITIPAFGINGAAIANILGTFVANPLNLFFLHKKGLTVRYMNYVKPIAIFVLFYIIYYFTPMITFWEKFIIFVSYILVNYILSVITRKDTVMIYQELVSMIRKREK